MDVLALLHDCLIKWVIQPVTDQFLGIFDLNGRFSVVFLFTSYCVAYGLFRYRQARGQTDAQSFWQFIGGSRVYFHRSALLDYRYYFVRGILKVALVLPIVDMLASGRHRVHRRSALRRPRYRHSRLYRKP